MMEESLSSESDGCISSTFNFVRPRVRLPKQFGLQDVLMCADEFAYHRQVDDERHGCLTRKNLSDRV